ncbi:hypothetical protein NDU88_005138 [Pleurodeles waltl]|uniref:Uncharacterized protein n=1 Tax=Pleurodeles waltl TaxID=8319 RepID=A0AAV7QGZ7_PLEWA|nr:hypothetical protein NDU88_005138 [Pleurodeles waltl]
MVARLASSSRPPAAITHGPPGVSMSFFPLGVAPLTPNPYAHLVAVSREGKRVEVHRDGRRSTTASCPFLLLPATTHFLHICPEGPGVPAKWGGRGRDERGSSSSGYQRSPPPQYPGSPFHSLKSWASALSQPSNIGKTRSGPPLAFVTGGLTSGSVCSPPPLCHGCYAAPKRNPVPRRPRALSTAWDADLAHQPPSWVWAAPRNRCREAG